MPRLFGILTIPVPMVWQPIAWNLGAIVITALVSLRLLTARIPALAAVAGAVGILAVPSAGDHWASISCLHFMFGAVLLVNLLEPPPADRREGGRRAIEVALGSLSGPEAIIMAPLALGRLWQWRRQPLAWGVLAAWFAGVAIELTALAIAPRETKVLLLATIPSLGLVARYLKILFGLWLGRPLDAAFANWLGLGLLAAFGFLWLGRKAAHRWQSLVCLAVALALVMAGRLVSLHWPNPFGGDSRLVYLPFVCVCWSIGWVASGSDRPRQLVAITLMAAIVVSALTKWTAEPLPNFNWPRQVAQYRAGTREVMFIPGRGGDGGIHPFPQYPPADWGRHQQ